MALVPVFWIQKDRMKKKSISQKLCSFIDVSMKCSTTDDLCRKFNLFINGLGFKGFIYTAIPGIPSKEPDSASFFQNVLLHCTDMQALKSHMNSELFGSNPILIRLVTGPTEPFTPYQAFKYVTGKPPPGRPEEILEDPSIAYSLVCPLDSPDRRCGVILLSMEKTVLKLYRQLWRVKNVAYSGTVIFHERWKTLVHKKNKQALSVREAECLMWVAQGKTAWEISCILSISERTVRFHLDNARGKLDSVNTTHTVALAIAQGLIPAEPFE